MLASCIAQGTPYYIGVSDHKYDEEYIEARTKKVSAMRRLAYSIWAVRCFPIQARKQSAWSMKDRSAKDKPIIKM